MSKYRDGSSKASWCRKMASWLLSVIVAIGLMPIGLSFADEGDFADNTDTAGAAVPGEVIVVYEANQQARSSSMTAAAFEAYGAEATETIADSINGSGLAVLVEVPDEEADALVAELNETPGVAFAQRNYTYYLFDDEGDLGELTADALGGSFDLPTTLYPQVATNDARLGEMYHLESWEESYGADVLEAWDSAKAESTVTVAVLDTGAKADHEDLTANLDLGHARNIYTMAAAGSISDTDGHGTHTAGIVGAVANNGLGVAGSSYNATVLPLCVFSSGSNSTTDSAVLVRAYSYLKSLIDSGVLTDLHVINMSLGGYGSISSDDQALENAIAEFRDDYQVLTVCAGGNGDDYGNALTDACYPSDFEECLSVTALSTTGGNTKWSDYNMAKDISAPGEKILSTYNSSSSSYATMSGTSMASPLVAGIAALLWAVQPELTVDQAVESLEQTANPVVQDANYHDNTKTGSVGAIDAAAAVYYVLDNYGEVNTTNISKAEAQTVDYVVYDGTAKTPAVTVTYDGKQLEEGIDYTVSYVDNVEAGTAYAVLSGIGNFHGTKRVSFRICYDITETGWAAAVAAQDYTGSAIEPNLRVYMPNPVKGTSMRLTKNIDYTLSYADNVEVGTARVTVTGMGSYCGSFSTTFSIVGKVAKPQLTAEASAGGPYTGQTVTAVQEGRGYTLSGQFQASQAGTYEAVATLDKGCTWEDGSTDEVTLAWTIAKATLTATYVGETISEGMSPTLAVNVTGFVNDESADGADGTAKAASYVSPTVVAPASLEAGKSYQLVPSGGSAANYDFTYVAGTLSVEAVVHDISSGSIASIADQLYTGSAVTPAIQVVFDGRELEEGVDYTLSFADNIEVGTATVTVTGTGSYTGTLVATFAIVALPQPNEPSEPTVERLYGDEAWETSAAIASEAFETSSYAVIARYDDFMDAMSATGLAGLLDAPILLTETNGLSQAAADEIERLGVKEAYVIGGEAALGAQVEAGLKTAGVQKVTRVYGSEAWDTSVACAQEITRIKEQRGEECSSAIVATSTSFQDALSISSFAYKYHVPILLETSGASSADRSLPQGAVDLLMGEYTNAWVYVPGGPGAVSYESVEMVVGGDRVMRLYEGETGYDTSNYIAKYMVGTKLLSADTVSIACGADQPKGVDALAGSALAGKAGGVMLLVNGNKDLEAMDTTTLDGFLADHASEVQTAYVLGGTFVVPGSIEDMVVSMLGVVE